MDLDVGSARPGEEKELTARMPVIIRTGEFVVNMKRFAMVLICTHLGWKNNAVSFQATSKHNE